MADGTKVTGFRVGNFAFTIEKPSNLADVLRDNSIDPGNGTFTVDGKTYGGGIPASQITVGPETRHIEVTPPAKGGGC